MKNDGNLKIAIEGSSLFEKSDGPGIYTDNLIENLALIEKKDLFYVYYPNAPLFGKSSLKIKQHNIKPKRSYFGLKFTKGIDVYHDTAMSFFYSPEAGRPGKKLIATIHDTASPVNADSTDTLQQKIFLEKLRRTINTLDAVITTSETSKQGLVEHFNAPSSKISVIRPGIEDFFSPATTYQKSLIKAMYSISGKYIIFSGKIEERKNIRRLLEAYSALKYESPPLLVFAGEVAWLKDGLFEMAG
ncbi:MAG: glycosyltransferase, partial [Candidatus Margulisiibacteriota bacterium]